MHHLPPVYREGEEGEDAGGHAEVGDERVHLAVHRAKLPHPSGRKIVNSVQDTWLNSNLFNLSTCRS